MSHDKDTEEERLAAIQHWRSRTPAERFAETQRLSIEHYGLPKGDLGDGPAVKYRRNSDGSEEVLSITYGPNSLRQEPNTRQ